MENIELNQRPEWMPAEHTSAHCHRCSERLEITSVIVSRGRYLATYECSSYLCQLDPEHGMWTKNLAWNNEGSPISPTVFG